MRGKSIFAAVAALAVAEALGRGHGIAICYHDDHGPSAPSGNPGPVLIKPRDTGRKKAQWKNERRGRK